MDAVTLRALDMSAQKITMEKSTIPHPDPRLGLFVSRTGRMVEVVRLYYSFQYYADLAKKRHNTKPYRKGLRQVTVVRLCKGGMSYWNC